MNLLPSAPALRLVLRAKLAERRNLDQIFANEKTRKERHVELNVFIGKVKEALKALCGTDDVSKPEAWR